MKPTFEPHQPHGKLPFERKSDSLQSSVGRVAHPWFEVTPPLIGAKAGHATPSVDAKDY